MTRIKKTSTNLNSWYILCALSLLTYLPFIFYFMWGNHDWQWVKEYTPLLSGVFEGRFSQFILPIALFEGKILPVLTLLTAITLYSLSAYILLQMWQAPQKPLIVILLGLNIVIAPYTVSWLYFAFLILSCLSWPLFVILGFWLLQHHLKLNINIILAIILFTLALGGYPPIINMIGTIFCTLALSDLCIKKLSVKSLIKKYLPYAISVIISVILLFFVQHLLKLHHLQYDTYNTAGITLQELAQKFLSDFPATFYQFVFTTSFIDESYKYITLSLVLLSIWVMLKNLPKKLPNILAFIIIIFGLLLSTIATLIAAQNEIYVKYEPRIEFFTLPYIYTFAAVVLINSAEPILKNVTFMALLFLAFHNFNNNTYAAKVWSLGFHAENNFSERFIKRLEDSGNFTPQNTQYTFVQGGTFSLRKRYYLPNSGTHEDSYTLTAPYIPWHLPYKAYTFYYPYAFVKQDFDIYWRYIYPSEIPLSQELEQYLLQKSAPWPQNNAIFISPSLIVLTLTYEGRGLAQSWYNQHFKLYPHEQ